jgi:ABC-type uncharacterized transport system permease subunit
LADWFFWLALLAYGVATVGYISEARRPSSAGRVATWGVRIGWLVQTALLVLQAAQADGFPWSTWAASLNLFVWLVVGVYLIWGCQARYRLLGLTVLPLAAVLLALAHAGGGTSVRGASGYSSLFLVLHVGLVLAAFAGFTLAAGLSGLYLWQERRLKRREKSILCVRGPALAKLDDLSAQTIAVAVPALTFGIAVGIVRLRERGGGVDALMVVTIFTWLLYGCYLGLRYGAGLRGRRAAYVVLLGFVLVAVARLALPVTHFS